MASLRKALYGYVVVLVFLVLPLQTASANWYVGNASTVFNQHGVRGNISAPSAAPYISSGGEYSWLGAVEYSTRTNWVQTGWGYFPPTTITPAKAYVEALVGGYYSGVQLQRDHSWGSYVSYRVQDMGILTYTYGAYVANTFRGSWGPLYPTEMTANTEVNGSSSNQVATNFRSLKYADSSLGWHDFFVVGWREDSPYHINSRTDQANFNVYGP